MIPDRVSVPAATVRPPEPEITPEKVSDAPVSRRVLTPSSTWPEPDRLITETGPEAPVMSKVPFTRGSEESPIEPEPDSFRVAPASMVVRPVKVLTPVRVMVPFWMSRPPPVPPPAPPSANTPSKVPVAAVSVRVLAPRLTNPEPETVLIEVPLVVREMSKVPLSTRSEESAIDPAVFSERVAPASMVVSPV